MNVTEVLELLGQLNDTDLDIRIYFTRKKPNGNYLSFSHQLHRNYKWN